MLTKIVQAFLIGLSAILLIPLLPFSVKIVQEYERGVIFRLGRMIGAKGPGLFVVLPIVDRYVRVDLRTVTLDVPSQEAITKDNVTVKVNAVVFFRVVDPVNSVISVTDHVRATFQISQTTLRSVLGQSDLDLLLSNREQINLRLQEIIDQETEPWGVKVSAVEVKDVELPASMQRAMARQAEAERERRAKIIAADGEFQASERLRAAADVMAAQPMTLQLRYLQTLVEMSAEKNSTVVFPLPIDLFALFLPGAQAGATPTPLNPPPPIEGLDEPDPLPPPPPSLRAMPSRDDEDREPVSP
jgi:regulator of protease activity HflC (stomatin/prohibitin superfamily)